MMPGSVLRVGGIGAAPDCGTEEIATSLCAQYSLGDDQFEEICKDVDGTLSAFFNASFLIYADK